MHSNSYTLQKISHKKNVLTLGFTLIEVLVVIVIISILVSILTISLLSQQQKSRDTSRNSKASVLAEALEKYFEKNGEYPSVPSLAGQPISAVKSKLGLKDNDLLIFPGAASTTTASIAAAASGTSTSALVYAGESDVAGSGCTDSATGYCTKYQLRYKTENNGNTINVDSRANPYIRGEAVCSGSTCLGAPTRPSITGAVLNSSTVRFTASAATCTAGTVEYKIRYNTAAAQSSSMPDWSTVNWGSATIRDVGSGSTSTFYSQSLARCVLGSDSGPVSQESTIHTLAVGPAAPVVSAAATGTSTIQLSWGSVSGATSYSVTGAGNASSCTASGCTVSGLAAATYYSFDVRAINSSGTSSPGTAGATTNSAASCTNTTTPTGLTASTTSSSSIQLSWNASSGTTPITYYVYYGTDSSAGNYYTGTSSTSLTISGLSSSTTYYFKIYAGNSCSSSSWTSTVNATTSSNAPTTPNTPSTPSVSVSGSSTSTWSWGSVYCNVGSPVYSYTYSSNTGASSSSSTTTGTSLSFTTNSQGYTYTVSVSARCNNGGTYSGYSGSGSASYLYPITSRVQPSAGQVGMYPAQYISGPSAPANSVWARGDVTALSGACPSGSGAYVQARYEIDTTTPDSETAWISDMGAETAWTGYHSQPFNAAMQVNKMFEMMFRARCINNSVGQAGPYSYSDIFGNSFLRTARNQATNQKGQWERGCGGSFGNPAIADACTVVPLTTFNTGF